MTLDQEDLMDSRDFKGQPAHKDLLVNQDLLVLGALMVNLEPLDLLVSLARQGLEVTQAHKGLLEQEALKDPEVM